VPPSPAPACAGRSFRFGPQAGSACALPGSRIRVTSSLTPGPRCLHHRAGFRRPFTTRAQGWMARPKRILGGLTARREWFTWTGRRSSTSATRTAHEHNHATARSPARTIDEARPACAGLGGNPPGGVEAPSAHRPPTPGDTVASSPLRTLRLDRDASAGCQPSFLRARGRPALAARPLAPSARKWMAELCPDPIDSDTSRHETAPALGGDPNAAPRSAEAKRRLPAISPHEPYLVSKHEVVGSCGLRTACFRETSGPNEHPTLRLRRPRTRRSESTGSFTRPSAQPRAASPESPRRDPKSAAPEMPSIAEPPAGRNRAFARNHRWGVLHSLLPTLGKHSAPNSDFPVTRRS